MENLVWSECNETLEDILKNPRVQLPQIIKLSSPICDVNTSESVEKDQIIVIHSKQIFHNVEGLDSSGKTIKIPTACPHQIRRRVAPGNEVVYESIKDLAKAEPLPRFVEVRNAEGIDNVSNGDRLKVVIVEKTGGVPGIIHFRNSSGKHVKISVEENISFQSSVSDGSNQFVAKLAEKSKEFPINASFQKNKDTPKGFLDLGVFTINKCSSETVVIASAKKSDTEYAITFPIESDFKFQVNSKLKMAKDEDYRQLCSNSSEINSNDIVNFLAHSSPSDTVIRYVLKYKKLQKILNFDYTDDVSVENSPKHKIKSFIKKSKKEKENIKEESKGSPIIEKKTFPKITKQESSESEEPNNEEEGPLPLNTLAVDTEQQEILKKEMKERERLAKLEKEQLKSEKKKEKRLKKEKEKEEKRKKKASTSSLPSSPIEIQSEDLYVMPHDMNSVANQSTESLDDNQSQLAIYLMSKVKKVRDCTTSLGFKHKSKKRGKICKDDIEVMTQETLVPLQDQSIYAGLVDDTFSESLYEALPCEMAYESLDLVAQAQRTLAPVIPTENSGDSGFDEIDQARIQAWRESMSPPPLPGNHPLQNHIPVQSQEENLYETAVDCRKDGMPSAWQSFYNTVEQSTQEISSWDMEDVSSCLTDLNLINYIEVFSDSQVDGQLLLDLDESVLKDLGLNAFEARKLRKFVFGWRPDMIRPPTYPKRVGFESDDPSQWSQEDVVRHLKVIEINDFSEFCGQNQVNGELLKDICNDETIMNTIITTRDIKLKTVKIKNYVIDKWRPKKKGEGNYVSSQSILPPEKRSISSPNVNRIGMGSPKVESDKDKSTENVSSSTTNLVFGVNRKTTVTGDMPLIAKMKQQLEENKNAWEKRK